MGPFSIAAMLVYRRVDLNKISPIFRWVQARAWARTSPAEISGRRDQLSLGGTWTDEHGLFRILTSLGKCCVFISIYIYIDYYHIDV